MSETPRTDMQLMTCKVDDGIASEVFSTNTVSAEFARQLETELAAMRAALVDMAKNGLRFDLNPTHEMGSWEKAETFWHDYFRRADESIKQRAARALLKQG